MNDFKEAYDALTCELTFKNYVHTNPICQVGGQSMYVEDIVKANIIAKQNGLILGDTGEGKSQIEKDVLAWFGHKGLFLLGRNDMDIREIYRNARFDPKTKQFVTELSEKLNYNLTVLDEATRCIPMVLNQVFNMMDGYIEIDGEIHKLGGGFSVGLASANLGNGKFLGTSQLDKAFLDRMHFVFDIDNYSRRPRDTLNILSSTKESRVKDENIEDKVELIKKLHEFWKKQETPLVNYIAVCHFYHGLDWLEGGYKNSKRMTKTWPNIQFEEHETGSDSALIYPISTRSAITYLNSANAFELVARTKGAEQIDSLDTIMEVFKIAGGYSGILNSDAVLRDHFGNPLSAMETIVTGLKEEIKRKIDVVEQGISLAQKGELNEKILNEYSGRWSWMKDIVEFIAEKAEAQEISDEQIKETLKGSIPNEE